MQIKTETKVGLFVIGALVIFFYISFQLGVFRLDRTKYRQYVLYFDDISGLDKKADVKIAGVKVGWVQQTEISDGKYLAQAYIMVDKKYRLYKNAQAKVRQESLIGSKYIELNPGSSDLPALQQGDALENLGRSSIPLDDVLVQAQHVINNLQAITTSCKETFDSARGHDVMHNIQEATRRFADFSEKLDRTLSHNQENIDTVLRNLSEFSRDIKETLPHLKHDIATIAQVFGTDVSQAACSLKNLSTSLESASSKIANGTGTIGKLINEEETYHDIRIAAQGLKNYFAKVNALQIVFDSHGEYMTRPAEHYQFFGERFEDAKNYFDMRIHPNDDYFYVAQLVSAQKGTTHRRKVNREWRDEYNNLLLPSQLLAKHVAIPELIGDIDEIVRVYDTFKLGLQVGKIYKDFVFRFGLFENTVGLGVDLDIPFDTDDFRWVTSLEIFDFRGRDRINDDRPHFKWINRVFMLRNLYLTFGADDFISKENANGFFGGGIRFCDEDIKYLAGKFGMSGLAT